MPTSNTDVRSRVFGVYLNGSHELWKSLLIGRDCTVKGQRLGEEQMQHFAFGQLQLVMESERALKERDGLLVCRE
jgi:hypothetical protein